MSNRYNSDNSAIIDATGKEWPVETAHPLPLPEGIDPDVYLPKCPSYAVLFGPGGSYEWSTSKRTSSTHWLARRPLPEVPNVKTQEELDREYAYNEATKFSTDSRVIVDLIIAAIAYARQCPAKPAS